MNCNQETHTNQDVQNHYASIAADILNSLDDDAICGRSSCCNQPLTASEASVLYTADVQSNLPSGALAASRGCGDPVAKAQLVSGEIVVDLGSGGGIDALIAGNLVGPSGHVYGIDMTPEMVELASKNAQDSDFANVEFIHASIEDIPLSNASVDVVLSNCVINFCDDKLRVMREAARILKPGGRFVVSDIVSFNPISTDSYEPLCRIVGCTKGMQSKETYESLLNQAGFSQVSIEPKTIYTLDVLYRKAEQKQRESYFNLISKDPNIDSASGSVIIYAIR